MVAKFKPVLLFYGRFLLPSLFVNILLVVVGIALPVSGGIKIMFLGLILLDYLNTKHKNKLTFYHNLSISTTFLFGVSLILDLFLLVVTYKIVGYAY